ncbi:MAG: HupE/UreJ family protein [Reyranella sp.]|uniref:HupE/UreJ family protein n=1 Tax=Reyranella sp. TaxID=1929291 RepID=UPI003D0C0DD8
MRHGWRRHVFATLPIGLLLLWIGSAGAHTGGTTGFARLTVEGQTVRYSLTLDLETAAKARDPAAGTSPAPRAVGYDALPGIVTRHVEISADGKVCAPLPDAVQPPPPGRSIVVIVIHYACAGTIHTLTTRDTLAAVFGRDHHSLTSIEWSGRTELVLLDSDRTEAHVTIDNGPAGAPAANPTGEGALGFFLLGIEHILAGFDHVLFIVALILGGGRIASLLGIITAFTVGHSITLAFAVLGLVRPPAWLIEPLIAASIAYVACENMFLKRTPSRRWLVALLFGLVHGFGFAGALLELEVPGESLFSSLLSFNLGVEAGQAMIIALLFPALLLLSRFEWRRQAVTALSAVILVAAIGLLAERTLLQ